MKVTILVLTSKVEMKKVASASENLGCLCRGNEVCFKLLFQNNVSGRIFKKSR